MTQQRRPLTAGLPQNPVDPAVEQAFVYKKPKPETPPPAQAAEPGEGKGKAAGVAGRAPLTTRIRTDFASALKRASLQRQLEGQHPNTLQDILEEALEPWLRQHGYLT
jgi:cell pole-organizing protein PopZ